MRRIPLTQGFFAVVDADDFERVNAFKWCASVESRGTKVYAIRWATVKEKLAMGIAKGKNVKIRMHRFVLGLPPLPGPEDLVVDHDNDDSLDNRKENLIPRTQEANMEKVSRWKRKGQKVRKFEDDEPWL